MGKKVEETRARRRPRRSFTPAFKADVVALIRQGLDRHLKTGHASTGQNRPTKSGRRDGVRDYRGRTSVGKPRQVLVGSLRENPAWLCA